MFNKKFIFVLIFLIIFSGAISAVSASDNVTADNPASDSDVIDEKLQANDGDVVLETSSETFKELNNSISKYSTVDLYMDYEYDSNVDYDLFGGITIDKTIVINGNNHVIDSKSARVFMINEGANVQIKDLKIVGANKTCFYNGGAIFNSGNLTLINCTIKYFSVENNGGAIYNNGVLVIANSILNENSAVNSDSSGQGGAVYNSHILGILNTALSANKADYGGAIFTEKGAVLSYIRTMLNTATVCGGAVYNEPGYVCQVNDSSLLINMAQYGGALYSCDASSCTFVLNSASVLGNNMYSGSVFNSSTDGYSEKDFYNVKIKKQTLKLSASKVTTTYGTSKYFKVKVVDESKKAVSGVKVQIKVYTGSKYKTYTATTGSDGYASFNVKNIAKGTHKVVASILGSDSTSKSITSSIKINAKTLKVITSTSKTNSASSLAIGIHDKSKAYGGITVVVKVFTGKKSKTIKLVTAKSGDKIGTCALATNMFSAGTHKVTVTISNSNYKGSTTTKLVILKSAKKTRNFLITLSNGKQKTKYV